MRLPDVICSAALLWLSLLSCREKEATSYAINSNGESLEIILKQEDDTYL